MATTMAIRVPRNAEYKQNWRFRHRIGGDPLDITGWTFSLDVKASAGAAGPPIASATFDNIVAAEGSVDVTLLGSDFSSVEGNQEVVRLAYDCLVEDSDGSVVAMVEGEVLLTPGVSTI